MQPSAAPPGGQAGSKAPDSPSRFPREVRNPQSDSRMRFRTELMDLYYLSAKEGVHQPPGLKMRGKGDAFFDSMGREVFRGPRGKIANYIDMEAGYRGAQSRQRPVVAGSRQICYRRRSVRERLKFFLRLCDWIGLGPSEQPTLIAELAQILEGDFQYARAQAASGAPALPPTLLFAGIKKPSH